MQWCEIIVKIPIEFLNTASDITEMAVPHGFYIEDYSDLEEEAPKIAHVDLIDEDLLNKRKDIAFIHIYINPTENPAETLSFLTDRFGAAGIAFDISQNDVNDEDWATSWKKYYKPVKIGKNIVVVPSWEEYIENPEDVIITLDPGMAFGTGTHATTKLCLELIEKNLTKGTQMLDIGTGSGILAIGALKLGALKVTAVDIDETAVKSAHENSKLNNVSEKIEIIKGDLADAVNGKFSLISANIVADVILRLIKDLHCYLAPGGIFLASGIIEPRESEIKEALVKAGFKIKETLNNEGWVAVSACLP